MTSSAWQKKNTFLTSFERLWNSFFAQDAPPQAFQLQLNMLELSVCHHKQPFFIWPCVQVCDTVCHLLVTHRWASPFVANVFWQVGKKGYNDGCGVCLCVNAWPMMHFWRPLHARWATSSAHLHSTNPSYTSITPTNDVFILLASPSPICDSINHSSPMLQACRKWLGKEQTGHDSSEEGPDGDSCYPGLSSTGESTATHLNCALFRPRRKQRREGASGENSLIYKDEKYCYEWFCYIDCWWSKQFNCLYNHYPDCDSVTTNVFWDTLMYWLNIHWPTSK